MNSEPDAYSPQPAKHERLTPTSLPTAGQGRKSRTVHEDNLYAILSRFGVHYLTQRTVYTPFFDMQSRFIALEPDCLIVDPRYGGGIIEVDGSIHDKPHQAAKDIKKDAYFTKMGWWVERIRNEDLSEEAVECALARHFRKVEEFP